MLHSSIINQILNGLVGRDTTFRTTGYDISTSYATAYLGLSSTTPNPDGTGVTEPTGNGYSRVLVGKSSQSVTFVFGKPDGESIENVRDIYFPESSGSWGDPLTHFVLFEHETGDDPADVLAYSELKSGGTASPITVSAPQTVVMFRKGDLSITIRDAVGA